MRYLYSIKLKNKNKGLNMEKVQYLLNQITEILLVEKTIREEKRKRGELFNIFNVLGMSTNEVKLHSSLLAELLNCNGTHGLGDKFLNLFIQDIIIKHNPPFNFDTKSAEVFVEYNIGFITQDYKEGGRIDILIKDKNNQTIIIENKIYARDQHNQMYRYYQYAANKLQLNTGQYKLLYLTLEGTKPCKDSLGSEAYDLTCISYRTDIISWLEKCLGIAAIYPIVRETIRQYIENLKEILSIMNENNIKKFLDILTSCENVNTTLDIIDQQWKITCRIREEFIKSIKSECEKIDFTMKCDDGISELDGGCFIHITDKNYPGIEFVIGADKTTKSEGYYMAFSFNPPIKKVSATKKFWPDGDDPNEDYPIGSTYLSSEINGTGNWTQWDNPKTLKDMVNGDFLNYIKKQLNRIKDENIFKTRSLLEP